MTTGAKVFHCNECGNVVEAQAGCAQHPDATVVEAERSKYSVPTSLEALMARVVAGAYSEAEMSRLPTFGGAAPASTRGVFSWDAARLLVQDRTGWRIVPRSERQ